MTEDLASKHRPTRLEDVVGQKNAVTALTSSLARDASHAFLLSGPSGVGKTTLARIAAARLGAEIQEIDGATFTGIDSMREVQNTLHYHPLMGEKKAIIVDEAHRISKQAWDSLLKIVEEPPSHVYWFLCTTDPGKLPATIRNRCTELKLKSLSYDALMHLLIHVDEEEKLGIDDAVLKLVASEAQGSARKALVNLATVIGVSYTEARGLLHEREAPQPVAALCKILMNGGNWLQAMTALANINDEPESVRIQISNYLAAVLRNSKSDKDAAFLLNIMEQFADPYHPGEKSAPLMISIGRVLYG